MIFSPWIIDFAIHPYDWSYQTLFIAVLGVVIGACLGSFAHATGWRLKRGISVFSPSCCDHCQTPLAAISNIPVIGWIYSRGKCRYCQSSIPVMILWSELIMGLLVSFLMISFDWPLSALLIMAITWLWIIMISDADAMIIDLRHIGLLGLTGMIMLGLTADQLAVFIGLSGMIVPAGCIYGLSLSYMMIRGKHGFGSADPWLLAAIGIWTGAIGGIMVFIFAAWIGVIYGFLVRVFTRRTIIILPFGVLLGISFITYIIAGWLWMLMSHTAY